MAFMPWSDKLKVGIAEIDLQHSWLVEQTNALHDALSEQAQPHILGNMLERLVDYTMNHFIVEEDLFNRLGYPETEAHKAEHDRFSAQVINLLEQHEQGELVGQQALELLKNWLTHHILKVDKAYVAHFRANGIEAS